MKLRGKDLRTVRVVAWYAHLDFSLQFDEVRRPLHDDVVGDIEMTQRRHLGQFVRQLVNPVVGHVQTDQVAQFVDVFRQSLDIVTGHVQVDKTIQQNPVVGDFFESIERNVQHLTTTAARLA